MPVAADQIYRLLNPRSIAVVGASDDSPWSQGFLQNLRTFPGELFMVNPRRERAFGRPCYPSLSAIGQAVDHAAILVAAARVPGVVKDMAQAGVKYGTVIASGFGEGDGSGRAEAEETKALCAEHGIALVGPNCYGFNNYAGTYISRYMIDIPNEPGVIGMSFQSGQLGAATADAAAARNIHFRYIVSAGNELVVDTNDYYEFFLDHDDIRVFGGMLERIPEPERFESIARRAIEVGKPIVVLKPGRSAAASRIAIAHTGAVTGSDRVTDAYLSDLGIIRVSSVEELAETAGLLAKRGWPKGPRTVFFGFSGGAAELFAEEAHGTSIQLPPHTPATRTELSRVSTLPEEVIHNPFDMTVDGAVHYGEIVKTLAHSGDFDVMVSQGKPVRSFDAPRAEGEPDLTALIQAAHTKELHDAAEGTEVLWTYLETSDTQPGIGQFSYQVPNGAYYALGRNGVQAISNVIDYGVARRRILARKPPAPVAPSGNLHDLTHSGPLSEPESKKLLRAYGFPISEDEVATDGDAAVLAADRIGYPVVLKVVAASVPHKSDVGGVELNLGDAAAVRDAYQRIVDSVIKHVPEAAIEGVLVSKQASGGAEFFAGITNDPRLGPMVAAGLGGIYIEVFKDAVLIRPPFTAEEAIEALGRLKSAALLAGARGGPGLDIEAFGNALARLGDLAIAQRERIAELDINPLFVLPKGQGVLAADALVVVRGTEGS